MGPSQFAMFGMLLNCGEWIAKKQLVVHESREVFCFCEERGGGGGGGVDTNVS